MQSFPPAFVISLKESAQRQDSIRQQFDALGIPFAFLDAVDGRQMDVQAQKLYDGARRLRCFGRHMTGGEWGCLLSHMAVYERIVKDGLSVALVFEDDVIPAAALPDVVRALCKSPVKYDLVRFFGSPKIERRPKRLVMPMPGDLWLSRLPGVHGGAHAYLITQAGARKLLDYINRNGTAFPIDTLLGRGWETGVESYAVNMVARQNLDFESAIGETRFDKTPDLSDAFKLFFPLCRGWFKICDHAGRRYMYWSALAKDKKLMREHGAVRSSKQAV